MTALARFLRWIAREFIPTAESAEALLSGNQPRPRPRFCDCGWDTSLLPVMECRECGVPLAPLTPA